MKVTRFGWVILCAALFMLEPGAAAAPCESLAELVLPNTTLTTVEIVAAGAFNLQSAIGYPDDMLARFRDTFSTVPAFCRVAATLRPSSDSDIKIEVWMPVGGWNGRFLGVGNGGWAGMINYGGLHDALMGRYAVASTDTGHTGNSRDASFALGHPEKLIDFGYRAVHEMTVVAKALVAAFYGKPPRYAYWVGCSTGGKQGLTEAQRYPDDYDGIIAGAPANYWTHLMAGLMWAAHATMIEPASAMGNAEFQLLHGAAIGACDVLDGVEDGVLENPAQCRFDPEVLRCDGSGDTACLTTEQVAAARKLYAPAANPRTGEVIFPGLARGSEYGWGAAAGGPEPHRIPTDHFKYVVFKDPEWNFRTLDFDRDVARADALDEGTLNAVDPDLRPFVDAGGKLILFHGWDDPLITPYNTIDYYESVVEELGTYDIGSSIRLFMAPGMGHCGVGLGQVDWLPDLQRWVEDGVAPDRIIASRRRNGVTDRARPLCPYPKVARYSGTGSIDKAANFECVAPEGGR